MIPVHYTVPGTVLSNADVGPMEKEIRQTDYVQGSRFKVRATSHENLSKEKRKKRVV